MVVSSPKVMIFVHSRKETSKTAEAMRELAAKNATSGIGYTTLISYFYFLLGLLNNR